MTDPSLPLGAMAYALEQARQCIQLGQDIDAIEYIQIAELERKRLVAIVFESTQEQAQ